MLCIKLKLKMFMETFTKIKSYLTSVITKKIQNITIKQITCSLNERETCGVLIKDIVRLKSKMYYFIFTTESKKAKSINKNVVDDELVCKNYKNALFNRLYMRNERNRTQGYSIGSYRFNEISLSSYYDEKIYT